MSDTEGLFRGLVEAAPDAFIGVGPDGGIVLANAQAEALFGYDRSELLGQPVEMLVPEAARAHHPGHRQAYFANPLTRPMGAGKELAGRRKDGTTFPAEISLSAIDTEDGLLVSAAIRDVTARKKAEAKFRALLETAPDAIVGVGADGCIALVNTQAESLFGFDRTELIGRSVETLVPEASRAIHPRHREAYFANPVTRPMGGGMELMGRRKDGTTFPAEISLSAIDTEGGLLVSAAVRDGTERKQAAIVNSAGEAIISKGLDGVITSWNPAAERMYGYRSVDVIGREIDVLVPADRLDEERQLRNWVRTGESIADYETVRLRADGTTLDVVCSMSPITDKHGNVVGVLNITRDISEHRRADAERRALEERLQQSQRLESLGQLAGGIAHDFNNLLAVILNYAGFVAEEIEGNAAAHADLEEIRRAAERATRLTHQLLTFARRETVEPAIIDLNAVVADVENLLSRTIGEDVELVVSTAPTLPRIRADRGQLEQILLNLAVNARDAMPEGGRLRVETRSTELDEEYTRLHPEVAPGRYVELVVSDTGEGMSAEVMARAFEPFYTTKAKGQGTGLGLATVYGIAGDSGGSVHLYSEVGIGTTVRVFLPAVQSALPVTGDSAVTARSQSRGETVLVVEDEAAMREVAVRILRRNGYRVLETASGDEALAMLLLQEVDLLLTDVVMPQVSGRELAERARLHRPDLPVLFMSGYSQGVLGPRRGVEDDVPLIQKPFNEDALVSKVQAVVSQRAPASRRGRGVTS